MAATKPTTTTPEEFEIYTPDHPKSNVWRYFGFPKEQGKRTKCYVKYVGPNSHATRQPAT